MSYVHANITNLTGHYATGGYFGFRIYTGKGNFAYASNPCFTKGNLQTQGNLPSGNDDWLYQILLDIISSPSGVILLRLSPIVAVLDELSYYAYHTSQYDASFKNIAEFCWRLNNAKWIPPFLNNIYQKISALLEDLQIQDWANSTPDRFLRRGETIYFLNNAEDYLFSSLPLTVSSFVLLWFIRRKVKLNLVKRLLDTFSTFSYLFIAILADNIQYLCFRSSQQLRFIATNSQLELISVVLALTILAFAVILGVSLYLLIWALNCKDFRFEALRNLPISFHFVTVTLYCRALTGFVHAFLDSQYLQLASILFLNIATLVAACRCVFAFRNKRGLLCYFLYLIFRILLGVILLAELDSVVSIHE